MAGSIFLNVESLLVLSSDEGVRSCREEKGYLSHLYAVFTGHKYLMNVYANYLY